MQSSPQQIMHNSVFIGSEIFITLSYNYVFFFFLMKKKLGENLDITDAGFFLIGRHRILF